MTDSGQRLGLGLCTKWAWARGRHYGRVGGRVTRSLACSTNGSCQPPSTKNRIPLLPSPLSAAVVFLFHLYFCTSRNAFNMKRQQARTASASGRDREGGRAWAGQAKPCAVSQAKLRQPGWQGWQGQCPSERLKRCQRWLFASSARQARRACGCGCG